MTTLCASTPYSKLFHCTHRLSPNLKFWLPLISPSFPSPFFFNWKLIILEDIDSLLVLSTGGFFNIIFYVKWSLKMCPPIVPSRPLSLPPPSKRQILWSVFFLDNIQCTAPPPQLVPLVTSLSFLQEVCLLPFLGPLMLPMQPEPPLYTRHSYRSLEGGLISVLSPPGSSFILLTGYPSPSWGGTGSGPCHDS